MNCEGCPGRGVCDGEPAVLAAKLVEKYEGLLVLLAHSSQMSEAGTLATTVLGFTMGYMVRTAEEDEATQVDRSIWGECFDTGV